MKKTFRILCAFISLTSFGQFSVVDFEDLVLPVDSFYTGEDFAGSFISQGVKFGNYYEEAPWGYYWTGFSYSNLTDDTTPGFDNQYSSYAGYGSNNSPNYAIFYPFDTITFPGSGAEFGNFAITNSTYSGISMRDGDFFAKKFGSPNGADGNPDGTDGNDFFLLTAFGWDMNLNLVDTINIYLADFRFSDSTFDYILKEWSYFDFSPLNGSKYITFNFSSSDIGEFGINTPQYFAMDDLEFKEQSNSLNANDINWRIFPNPASNVITILGGNGPLQIRNCIGQIVYEIYHFENSEISIDFLESGSYSIELLSDKVQLNKKLIIL